RDGIARTVFPARTGCAIRHRSWSLVIPDACRARPDNLRRHESDPTQHHRRAGIGIAEGIADCDLAKAPSSTRQSITWSGSTAAILQVSQAENWVRFFKIAPLVLKPRARLRAGAAPH